MSVLWIAVADEPGPRSLRGYLERISIAPLSSDARNPIDLPDDTAHATDREVRSRYTGWSGPLCGSWCRGVHVRP